MKLGGKARSQLALPINVSNFKTVCLMVGFKNCDGQEKVETEQVFVPEVTVARKKLRQHEQETFRENKFLNNCMKCAGASRQ